ncbi:MAG: SH3 domain-containing protein [Anaerolinea sp.]|nr:SH3 domain-containing protein [Anaerolinea sp.]
MSKSKFVIVMLTLAVLLLSVLPTLAQDGITASVSTGAVNVRSGPGMQFGSLATLPFGFGVNLVARNVEGNWVLVSLTNGVSGWINVNYLYVAGNVYTLPISETPVQPAVVPTGSITGYLTANVRTAPDPNGQIVATAPLGTAVTLLGRNYNATWVQIRLPNGTTGWVEAIAVSGTVPVRGLARTDGSVFVPGAPDLPQTGGNNSGATAYVIRAGDTLWAIAQRYGVNIHTLAAYNGIYNYDLIYAGLTLYIPN